MVRRAVGNVPTWQLPSFYEAWQDDEYATNGRQEVSVDAGRKAGFLLMRWERKLIDSRGCFMLRGVGGFMTKLLFFGLLVFVVYLMLRGQRPSAARASAPDPAAPPVQRMVACGQCGVHLPENESLQEAGQHYCCEQHRLDARSALGSRH